MTGLAQIALAFCRECLRWERPADRRFAEQNQDPHGNPSRAWTPYVFDFYGKHGQLHFTDLSSVAEAARHWCDQNDASLELAYHGILPGEWEARIVTPVSLEAIVHADPCHALLAACVQADRKLKSAAGSLQG